MKQCENLRDIVFLPIGFSSGWRTKTVGVLLSDEQREGLVKAYQLDRGHNSDPFPKTRKIVRMPDGRELPMGWARLSLVKTPVAGDPTKK